MSDFNLGTVTAYGYAKDKGYTGTEDEYAELMASYADVAEQAAESAEQAAASATTATAKASEAAQSATSAASSKTAAETAQGGAETAAQTATTKAGEASASATTASGKATEATTAAGTATTKASEATTAATTATTKAGEASTSATNAAASATRAQEILDSIPEDYSQMSEDVADLKDGLTAVESDVTDLKVDLSESVGNLKSALIDDVNGLNKGSVALNNWVNHGLTQGQDNINRNSWVADYSRVFSSGVVINVSDHPGITNLVVRINEFDSNKSFLVETDYVNPKNRAVTLNANTAYIRVQLNDWDNVYNDNELLQYFTIWAEYGVSKATARAEEANTKAEEAIADAEEASAKVEEAKQLAGDGVYDLISDNTELISRSRLRGDLTIVGDGNASRTDYIPVAGGEQVQFTFKVTEFTSRNGSLMFGTYANDKSAVEIQTFPFTTKDISGKLTLSSEARFVIVAIASWNTDASYGVASTVFGKLSAKVLSAVSKHLDVIDSRLDALESEPIAIVDKYNEQVGTVVALADNYRGAGMVTYPKNLCLMMISDTHSDNTRVRNAIELSEAMGIVDAVIHLGDTDADSPLIGSQNGMVTMMSSMTITKPFFGVLGNHDVRRFADSTMYLDVPEAVTRYQKQLNTASMYSNRGYGYYDFTNEKIRLIILNDYDYPDTTDSNGDYVFYDRNLLFQQDQIDFFVSALNGMPSGFTALLATHWCDTATIDDTIYPQHNDSQNLADRATKVGGTTYMSGEIISEIIHAFKVRGTLSKTYTYSSGSTSGSVSVNADFSNATGLFACQICGHKHKTAIAKPDGNSDYWIYVNDTSFCAIGTNGAHKWATAYSNIPRLAGTNTEDLITCLCIDTSNKLIKFARIGAHITRFADDENARVISYDI